LSHLQLAANRVHSGLNVITETFCSYVSEILNVGADGIFFATTAWGTTDRLTEDDYATFGRPYDLQILQAARDAWFNVLHVCRDNNMLNELTDYPVHAINWDSHAPGNASLEEARVFLGKVPMGGVSRENLLSLDAPELQSEIGKVIRNSENKPIIIAPNCSISPRCPEVNLSALAEIPNV
jgi:uroporphyrinogen decarboxylase